MSRADDRQLEPYHYHLGPGYIFVNSMPSLISAGLGSAVAVCVWDRVLGIGGMSHFQYPRPNRRGKPTAKYGTVSIRTLIKMLIKMGSKRENLQAQVFGGGHRFQYAKNMGQRNLKVARRELKRSRVPIISEDVGGVQFRRVLYHTATNEILCMKTNKSHQEDWYPHHRN